MGDPAQTRHRTPAFKGGALLLPLLSTRIAFASLTNASPLTKFSTTASSSPIRRARDEGEIEVQQWRLQALGEEDQGGEGPEQAQEATQRVLRVHGAVQEGLQGEAPQRQAGLGDWQGWW